MNWLAPILVGALILLGCEQQPQQSGKADPSNRDQVAIGAKIYAEHCAACHGSKLEGQPNWRTKLPGGRMPAPPHDESGHTWHHSDEVLFGITKEGLVPGRYAPPGYASDMPAFGALLSDIEIWAVLAYIKTSWKDPRLLASREEMLRNVRKR